MPIVTDLTEKITIPVDEYCRLLNRDLILVYLESMGVDNWVYYDEAIEMMEADNQDD